MDNLNDQMLIRREKMNKLREMGVNPFSNGIKPSFENQEIINQFDKFSKEELDENKKVVSIAGRIMTKRGQGKAGFATIKDHSSTMQIYVATQNLDKLDNNVWNLVDLGDIIFVEGEVMKTKVGALAIRALRIKMLTKALHPLPEKFHGLTDKEERYRKRHLDLIVNDESKVAFVKRSKIIKGIRNYLNDLDYLEVETPILQLIAGGANAKPFITHHNTLDVDMYLRIAPELYLKQLIIGGMNKVYEIGKLFRNEGMSIKHNPEFTSIEIYSMYEDIDGMIELTKNLIQTVCLEVNDGLKIEYDGVEIDFGNFNKIHMVDLIKQETGINFFDINDLDEAIKLAKVHNVHLEKHHHKLGHIINEFFEQKCEETLIQPSFVYGHPIEISPLSRIDDNDPRFTERFELFIGGREYANGFSELNDPIDQLARFELQLEDKELGNDESHEIDYDYVKALETGLPPTGGLGIGIDRLVMLLTDSKSIRDVIFFPTMKKK